MVLGLSAAFTASIVASAQPQPPRPPPPATSASAAPVAGAPGAPAMPADYVPASTTPVQIPDELLKIVADGLTSEQVAVRAARTSFTAKAAEENLRGAAARVDAAWVGFLPRLTGTAKYTRLSDFTPPSLGGGYNSIVTTQPPLTPVTPATQAIVAPPLAFPLVLDNFLLQANITVPITDYFLRLNQNYTAATHSQNAYRFDAIAAKAKAASDGRIAYYTWLRSRGAVIVAIQALNDQKTHLKDAQNQFQAGNASRADVLRAETAVSSAELTVERAKNLLELSAKQMTVAMHANEGDVFLPGEQFDAPLPALQGNLKQMTLEALSARYEIKSIDANAESARQTAAVVRAGKYPVVTAFADGIYANPNPRRFPATNQWFGTWDVGAQIIWSPNDLLVANASVIDAETRATALEAKRGVVRDGIEVEIVQAYQGVREADFSIDAGRRELASAVEANRVARELFNAGRGTSTTLTDAETELTRSRLDVLNAHIDARVARVKLDHALGRDLKPFTS
jgi:outer membrane protein TolC